MPLVGSDESDWTILSTQWGVLGRGRQIGHTTRDLGWIGVVAAMAWLAYRVWSGAMKESYIGQTPG